MTASARANASLCISDVAAFDPDIAGVGIVVSFAATAISSMLLVVFGYAMGEFPGIDLTLVDAILVEGVFRRHNKHAKKWEKCFRRVLLSLADQQLVTSLAITVATFLEWRKISLYSLDMTWTLVITSLVTHLATIRYCPKYLREHRLLSAGRIMAIWIVIAGFIALQITRDTAFFAAFEDESSRSIAWQMLPFCLLAQNPGLPSEFGYDVLWEIILVLYFGSLLDKLYYSKDIELQSSSFLYRLVVRKLLGEDPGKFNNFRQLYESRDDYISQFGFPYLNRFQPWLRGVAAFEAAYFATKASDFADIPWLFFVLAYCITKLVTTWLASDSPFWDTSISEESFGFGQIIALMLLLLPMLTAFDAIVDVFRKKKSEEVGQTVKNAANSHTVDQALAAESRFFETPRPDCLYRPGEDLRNNVIFRVSVYILAGWSITIFIFCAVITAVPWYNVGLNLGATLPYATWFLWSSFLEAGHIFIIILRLVTRLFRTGYRYCQRTTEFERQTKLTQERQGSVSIAVLMKHI